MHDVHRDSLIAEGKKRKVTKSGSGHAHDKHAHSRDQDHGHAQEEGGVHNHGSHSHDRDGHDHHQHHDHEQGHAHEIPHGHGHDHAEDAYEGHNQDFHTHDHDYGHRETEDRAFAHIHEHGHDFFHAHHHTHYPEHAGVMHKIFGDPQRDWFAVFLMGVLVTAGHFKWLPGHLPEGMLICAAVIGIFPLLKNALFDFIYKRVFRFELPVGLILLAGLFMGRFLGVSLIALMLLIGSFLRLNFSWKE